MLKVFGSGGFLQRTQGPVTSQQVHSECCARRRGG
jgi:hypothetical protein